jgi:chaperonin cofactor prefoldin
MSDIDPGSIQPMANNGQPFAKFMTMEVKDEAASAARGRYVGRKVEMVRIIIPGDKHNIVERRVRESDKQRWPKQWEAFRRMEDFVPDGTIIDTWPMLSKSQVEDLKYNNIYTVEAIADLPDDKLSALGLGGRMLRKHAQAFIETAKKGVVPAQLVSENERLNGQVNLLVNQIAELTRRLESMASKAGEKIEDIGNPIQEAKLAVNAAAQQNQFVEIPQNYEQMGLPALRALCGKFSDAKVLTKDHALELIEDYKASLKVKI